ncbi:hypothetical protein GCM10027615_18350 [Plantactinospora veratri]
MRGAERPDPAAGRDDHPWVPGPDLRGLTTGGRPPSGAVAAAAASALPGSEICPLRGAITPF